MSLAFADALTLIERRCAPAIGEENITLACAQGRVLARPVMAPIDVPGSDNSAVDGYAVRWGASEDFEVVGVSAAGRPFEGALQPGQAVRIFTGAMPPDGTDAIAMQEHVDMQTGAIRLRRAVPAHANIRRVGEDIGRGTCVLPEGKRIGPIESGILASMGIETVSVRRRLRVAVLSGGDELVRPERPYAPGAVHDSNRPMLLALLSALGFEAIDRGIIPDRPELMADALRAAAACSDAVIASAGVSVGDEDHVQSAVQVTGALEFARVAIRPGKPFCFGQVAGATFFGLPGNPVAALTTFLLLARPGLLRLAGATTPAPRRISVRAGFNYESAFDRRDYLRCVIEPGEDLPVVHRFGGSGSAILSSVAGCDGLLEISEGVAVVPPGMVLPFLPLAEFAL